MTDEPRVLDLAVDEALFGRTHEVRKRHEWQAIADHYGSQCIRCEEVARNPKHVSTPCQSQPPAYSSDANACTLVKQRLRDAGIPFVIRHSDSGVVSVARAQYQLERPDGQKLIQVPYDERLTAVSDCEEQAVCRFALACARKGLLEENA